MRKICDRTEDQTSDINTSRTAQPSYLEGPADADRDAQ